MSRRSRLGEHTWLSQSFGTASFTSSIYDIDKFDRVSLQMSWYGQTGALLSGTIQPFVSNDYVWNNNRSGPYPLNTLPMWTAVPPATIISGSSGNAFMSIDHPATFHMYWQFTPYLNFTGSAANVSGTYLTAVAVGLQEG